METILVNNSTMAVLDNDTMRRANVIALRTGNVAMGIIKSDMINELKVKLQNGVAHFTYIKDSTQELREAFGTTAHNLMKANINGNGINRDIVNTICYWDVNKGGFRSLRFENLVQVF